MVAGMGQARHLPSLFALLGVAMAVAIGGCGSSGKTTASTGESSAASPAGAAVATCKVSGIAGVEQARVIGAECPFVRGVVASWNKGKTCRPAAEGSYSVCSVGGLRCLGSVTERGLSVSCTEQGRSISFLAKRS